MATFTVLDQAEEDKLHATRLLGIEERPFKRLTKRLLAPNTPFHIFLERQASQTEEETTDQDASWSDEQQQTFLKDLQRFREEAILDFAAFESSIARIQFLHAANEKERERYASEKIKIEATANEVRDNTATLRVQLDEAQKTLAIRKTYDVLADKITKNASLKPRDEQHVAIEKLKAEIEELERESQEHSQAWLDRREQFSRVMDEGARMRRVVRDEKDPEKEEEGEDSLDDQMLEVDRDRDGTSNVGTPRPHDDASTPLPSHVDSGAMTPRSNLQDGRGRTPDPDLVKPTNDTGTDDVDMADEEGQRQLGIIGGKAADDMDTT